MREKHQFPLLLILLLVSLIFLVALVKETKVLFYPQLHRFQLSPKKFIEQKAGQLPTNLPKPEVIEHGSRIKHEIALTFDADMTQGMLLLLKSGKVKSWYNSEIKKILDSEHVKATIFLGGLWSQTYPREAYDLAHDPLIEIGNHSFGHPAFTQSCYRLPIIDNSSDRDEVQSAQEAIRKTTGITPKYFRFPGGCYDQYDLETIAKLGLTIIHWDIAPGDGFNLNPDSIINNVLSKVQNGSIVVFHIHDGSFAPKTHVALKKIIPQLKRQGFKFVTISELLADSR